MTQTDSLLLGILDDPADEARRLVLADWLEEQGDPANAARAELLRLQCAHERLSARDPERQDLQWRAQGLLGAYPNLAGPLPQLSPTLHVLETGLALVVFLGAELTAAADDGFEAGAVWQGQLRQRKFRLLTARIRTTWTVLQRQGNVFTGEMAQRQQLLVTVEGKFSFAGAVLCGRLLAFVTDRLEGPVMTPGLYLARREGDALEGTWRVPLYRDQGTFRLTLRS
jgi:uncharacterized protein (TIGR02996 family)